MEGTAGTDSRIGNLGIGIGVEDAEEPKLHAHIGNVACRSDLHVLRSNAESNDLVALAEARESDEVAGQKGGHDEGVGCVAT